MRVLACLLALSLPSPGPAAAFSFEDLKPAPETKAVRDLAPDPPASPRTATMNEARIHAAAVRLVDGRVLVAGGRKESTPKAGTSLTQGLSSAEIYDPKNGRWSSVAPMRNRRYDFGATLLRDGRVLVAGGQTTGKGPVLAAAEIFDPRTGRWKDAAPMNDIRNNYTLVTLADGRALAAGGNSGPGQALTSAEVYDPRADAWTPTPPLSDNTWAFMVSPLGDGRALMVSDYGPRAAMLYDPRLDAMSHAPPASYGHEAGYSVALADGRILVAGGHGRGETATTEIFDPESGTWSTAGSLSYTRMGHALVSVGRRAVAAGGSTPGGITASVEIFDPAKGAWRTGPWLATPRFYPASAALDQSHVLIAGGTPALDPNESALRTSEVIDLDAPVGAPPEGIAVAPVYSPQAPTFAAPAPYPALAPAVQRFARKAAERPHDFAVVVGVGRYERLPPADYAEDDARDAAAMLAALGVPEENVITLSGPKAKMTEIVKYVEEWLPRRVEADSRVYFFYSGHGAPDVKDGTPYLMPWDADVSFVKSTALPLDRLYEALGKLPVREVVAVLDACFSGAGGRSVLPAGARPLVAVKAPARAAPKISILAASQNDEIAGGFPEQRHGLFTWYVLQGLRGAADTNASGHVTLSQLHAYVRKRVIMDARKQDREQTPTLTTATPGLRLY